MRNQSTGRGIRPDMPSLGDAIDPNQPIYICTYCIYVYVYLYTRVHIYPMPESTIIHILLHMRLHLRLHLCLAMSTSTSTSASTSTSMSTPKSISTSTSTFSLPTGHAPTCFAENSCLYLGETANVCKTTCFAKLLHV